MHKNNLTKVAFLKSAIKYVIRKRMQKHAELTDGAYGLGNGNMSQPETKPIPYWNENPYTDLNGNNPTNTEFSASVDNGPTRYFRNAEDLNTYVLQPDYPSQPHYVQNLPRIINNTPSTPNNNNNLGNFSLSGFQNSFNTFKNRVNKSIKDPSYFKYWTAQAALANRRNKIQNMLDEVNRGPSIDEQNAIYENARRQDIIDAVLGGWATPEDEAEFDRLYEQNPGIINGSR